MEHYTQNTIQTKIKNTPIKPSNLSVSLSPPQKMYRNFSRRLTGFSPLKSRAFEGDAQKKSKSCLYICKYFDVCMNICMFVSTSGKVLFPIHRHPNICNSFGFGGW